MKRVVSVSLGSSKRDKRVEAEFFGEPFLIERISTDGDLRRFAEWLQKLDGKVDALCFGGMDIWLRCGRRKYALREAWQLAQLVRKTPVVDGSGVKDTVEREAVHWLQRRHLLGIGLIQGGVIQDQKPLPQVHEDLRFLPQRLRIRRLS